MSDEIPVAQGTETAPVAAETNQGASPGVQARIDELVAKQHDRDRQIQEQQATIASMMAALAQQQAPRNNAQADQPPPFEIDPEEKRKLDYFLQQATAPLTHELDQVRRQLVSQEVRQFQSQVPPEVLQAAENLKLHWMKQGKQGWLAEDAITYAYGEYAKKQAQQGQHNAARHSYNQAASNVSMAPSSAPVPQATNFGLPRNIDSLPLSERIALREKALGDLPWED